MPVREIVEWFATYVYLPKLRDRVVLESAIRDAIAKLDPKLAYADDYDEISGKYTGLVWQKAPIVRMPATGLLVRPEVAIAQLRPAMPVPSPEPPAPGSLPPGPLRPPPNAQSQRFFGSVEIDLLRPVRAFETILNAVVKELERAKGAKLTLTLEIEARAEEGFSEADIAVVRDNARQLKFKPESTGFE